LGNKIATLINEEKEPGVYEVEFQSSFSSRQLASGIYLYKLQIKNLHDGKAGYSSIKKMILLK